MNNLKNDLEYFDFLTDGLKDGSIKYIKTSENLFEEIATSFPIESNRINWDLVPHSSYVILEKYPQSVEVINSLIIEIIKNNLLDEKEDVSICFDGLTEGAFTMKLELLKIYAGEIFTIPQHIYVIPKNINWCINYTFEDILYFGNR